MKTIRAGVVGPGSIGINHARIYSELAGGELVAIYDGYAIVCQDVPDDARGRWTFFPVENMQEHYPT